MLIGIALTTTIKVNQQAKVAEVDLEDQNVYQPASEIFPHDIDAFIRKHPNARLDKLWEQLQIDSEKVNYGCWNCVAETIYQDLDGLPGDEALMRVGNTHHEVWRFLVFKRLPQENSWQLLDFIDVYDRYRPAAYKVQIIDGSPYLTVTQLAARGSGLGLWEDRVYQVQHGKLKEILSYLSEAYLGGGGSYNTELTTRLLKLRSQKTSTIATVEYALNYSYERDNPSETFFAKPRNVTISSKSKWGTLREENVDDYESAALTFIEPLLEKEYVVRSELRRLKSRN